ncbi:hypothetical protein [Thalassotalea sp. ND16A]|uniref:hypothetical protein n=1 Tax=Thalassotalea sp. ND16A TaxID=1535422 RepID=UPI00126A5522|nr:hypothetical protein [Thalassotalea sp. ND16A]
MILTELEQRVSQVKAVLVEQTIKQNYQSLDSLKPLVDSHSKEHKVLLSDIAILADISANTLTRLLKDPQSAKVSTLTAVLGVLGKSIYIGQVNG